MRNASWSSAEADIHSFPGANLSHVPMLLDTATFAAETKNIVIAIGINNRGWFIENNKKELSKIAAACQRTGKACHFLGISYDEKRLRADEVDTIKHINRTAREKFFTRFIHPLPCSEVHVSPKEKWGIHYDAITETRVVESVMKHCRLN